MLIGQCWLTMEVKDMSAAQCKAARRRMKNDGRYKPKKGSRSKLRAAALQRKILNAGGGMRSIGHSGKKGG